MNIKDVDIVRIARDAGINNDCDGIWCNADQLQRFAKLVAAHEREECAKLFESIQQDNTSLGGIHFLLHDTAKAIRARSTA
jgi:hypothetical protein